MGASTLVKFVKDATINLTPRQRRYLSIKRVIDFALALIGLVLLLPFFLIIAIVLKVESPREPVLFKQERVGHHGKPFILYKFRTMKSEAPHEMSTSTFVNAELYITKVGRFLRNTSIDELPQLYNILRGEMAFFGPRPLILSETIVHNERNYYGVYQVRPGLSGLAQVHGRDGLNDTCKVLWDRKYVANIGIMMDISIFCHSVIAVIRREGVIDGCKEKLARQEENKETVESGERIKVDA